METKYCGFRTGKATGCEMQKMPPKWVAINLPQQRGFHNSPVHMDFLPAPSEWEANHWLLVSVGRKKNFKTSPVHWSAQGHDSDISPRVPTPTGKSLFSFFRGSWGICPGPSAFSSMCFSIPLPLPEKEPRHGLTEWNRKISSPLCWAGVEQWALTFHSHISGSWTLPSRASRYPNPPWDKSHWE